MWIVGTTRSGWIGYGREMAQNRCLNIAAVKPVNPVFPVFNIYGVYGIYGIYGHTFHPLILLIKLYPRQFAEYSFQILLPFRGGRVGSSPPLLRGRPGRGFYYVITMILLCYSKHFVIHYLNLKKDNRNPLIKEWWPHHLIALLSLPLRVL